MDDGGRYNRRAALTMTIALIVMLNTLGPILAPPTNLILNASNPTPEMTEAEFRVKQLATKNFWVFTNSAFALALTAALVQVGKLVGHGTSEVCEKISFMLVMIAPLLMSFAAMCAIVVRLCPSSLLSAFSLVQGLCLLMLPIYALACSLQRLLDEIIKSYF